MGLTKNDIIEILNKSNLPLEQITVVMGAALVLHNIKKETNDIDVSCPKPIFTSILDNGFCQTFSKQGMPKIIFSEYITLYYEWPISSDEMVCGIKVDCIEDIIRDKKRLGREKDFYDIRQIEFFLREGSKDNDRVF